MEDNEETKEESEDKAKAETEAIEAEKAGNEEEQAIVKKAEEVAKTQKEAEELKAKNLDREEALVKRKEALAALGGGSDAGTGTGKPEQSNAQYAKDVQEGKYNGKDN